MGDHDRTTVDATVVKTILQGNNGFVRLLMQASDGTLFELPTRDMPVVSPLYSYTIEGRIQSEAPPKMNMNRPSMVTRTVQVKRFEALPMSLKILLTMLEQSQLKPGTVDELRAQLPTTDDAAAAWVAMMRTKKWFEHRVCRSKRNCWWFRIDEYRFWSKLYPDNDVFDLVDAERLDTLRHRWNTHTIGLAYEPNLELNLGYLEDAVDCSALPRGFDVQRPLDSVDVAAGELYNSLSSQRDRYYSDAGDPQFKDQGPQLRRLESQAVIVVRESRIYTSWMWEQITALRSALSEVRGREREALTPSTACVALDSDQSQAVSQVATQAVSVVTGGPGTGKTHVIRNIVALCGADSTLVCALTGKASANLKERNVDARTIHSALTKASFDPAWTRHFTTLLVEEASMVDVALLLRLLAVLPALNRIVFVGDKDQLTPIVPGSVLQMLCGVIPTTTLTENHRVHSASKALSEAAEGVREGKAPQWTAFENATKQSPVLAFEHSSTVELSVMTVLDKLKALWPKDSRRVQIVAYTNHDVRDVNSAAKRWFHPQRPQGNGMVPGERLCFLRNHTAGRTKVRVSNGQISCIKSIRDHQPQSKKRGRNVESTAAPHKSRNHDRIVTLDNGDTLKWDDFKNVTDLGYAITVHRAQGAEAPIVVFFMPSKPKDLEKLDRRLLYTALTRASRRFVLIGSQDKFNHIVKIAHSECNGEPLLASTDLDAVQ